MYEIEFTEYSKFRPYFFAHLGFFVENHKTQNAHPGKSEISHMFYQYEMQVLCFLSTFLEIAFTKHNIFWSDFCVFHIAGEYTCQNEQKWVTFSAFLQFCKRSLLLKQKMKRFVKDHTRKNKRGQFYSFSPVNSPAR